MTRLPTDDRPRWFDLPTDARDWVGPGGRYAFHLGKPPYAPHDWLIARERLGEWDQITGRLIRASLFAEDEDARALRKLAEAVAAVAESLAVALGETRR